MDTQLKQELKALLKKYKASIVLQTEGEGYSQIHELVLEVDNVPVAYFGTEITEYDI